MPFLFFLLGLSLGKMSLPKRKSALALESELLESMDDFLRKLEDIPMVKQLYNEEAKIDSDA